MTNVFHYTKGYCMASIIADGCIKREGEAGNYMIKDGHTANMFGIEPRVWFTTEKQMPFTATPVITDNMGEKPFMFMQMTLSRGYAAWAPMAGGVFRLAFDAEIIGAKRYWYNEIRQALVANDKLALFEKSAKLGNDDVRSWYHCDAPVSLQFLKYIETWNDGSWEKTTPSETYALPKAA